MSEKMNVLFIMTDQQRADHMSCAGNPILKTPNIDSIANGGIRFANTYCTNPMCTPNRACLLTGLYPNMSGVRSNGIKLPLDVPTITQSLLDSGEYQTAAIGKIHLQYGMKRIKKDDRSAEHAGSFYNDELRQKMIDNFPRPYYGFNEVEVVIGHGDICTGHYTQWLEERAPQYLEYIIEKNKTFFEHPLYRSEIPEELYPSSYITERTIAFLERFAQGDYGNKSFFVHCSYPDPHHPVCPPGKYYDMYNPDDIELPSSFNDAKGLHGHKFIGKFLKSPIMRGALLRETTEEEARKFIALTYGSIAMIDHGVGQILASLEKLGLADNTMIIYTADHGDLMGDHGLLLKGPNPFNGVLQIPLLWKVPGLTKTGVSNTLVSSIDIPKTIMNLLNIKKKNQPPDMQGVDLTQALKDPNKKIRDCCLVEEDEEMMGSVRVRHLITEDHKLTVYQNLENYGDLFDRKNDPDELNNLWFDENSKNLRNELVNKLLHEILKAQSRYPHLEGRG